MEKEQKQMNFPQVSENSHQNDSAQQQQPQKIKQQASKEGNQQALKQGQQQKISKKQLKKQLKKQKWEQAKMIKRKQKKIKQKQRKKMKKQLQKHQNQQNGQDTINKNQEVENIILMRKRKEDYQQNMKEGLKIIIDMQFFDLMSEKQLNSLVKQLGYCHAVNRKAQKPFNFILTSVTEERKQFIDTKYNGNKWGITLLPNILHQEFDINKLVYLTGDAEQTIQEFDDNLIYIIGGIVDHNRLKKITYNYANQHKIMVRKLPFQGIKLKTNVHLAVNHVWEWMLKKYNGNTWKQALQNVLPSRKIFKQNEQQ